MLVDAKPEKTDRATGSLCGTTSVKVDKLLEQFAQRKALPLVGYMDVAYANMHRNQLAALKRASSLSTGIVKIIKTCSLIDLGYIPTDPS